MSHIKKKRENIEITAECNVTEFNLKQTDCSFLRKIVFVYKIKCLKHSTNFFVIDKYI